ncbi:CDP-diacylglycerol--glycerol-3-phosphate 3-phosphatidyltransferase [Granulicoccus phenolivorans]|uniref:CDP-diacylglycerol--glycerol-3-phosphate 3-phosphatidyltransferase n=1 Tax=Granulicoccus phenolivorans TaxID=266854 RepID=UPI0003F4EF89|nr:CDP-diacylglycerol--glycerol-3-phosphate 3-phosphatidyltransferase [Granulicoccus phenolivorans]
MSGTNEAGGTEAAHPDTQPKPSNWNVPNVLTGIRILFVPLYGWMLLSHPDDPTWRIWTTVVFIIGILTDTVDGWWARRYNLVTSFGKIADPFADKAITGMALVGFSILGELPWIVTILILIREWGITLLRFLLLRRGIVLAANKGGKAKTLLQSVAIVLYTLPLPGYVWGDPLSWSVIPELFSWLVMAAAFVMTIVSGIDYVVSTARMNRKQPEARA